MYDHIVLVCLFNIENLETNQAMEGVFVVSYQITVVTCIKGLERTSNKK